MADKRTDKRKKSIIWPTLAGLLLAVVVILFLLPTVISTDWAGNKIKQEVNKRLPGTIDFETLSVSWFSGIKSRAISYDDRKQGIRVKVAELNASKGLLALAIDHKEMGSVEIKAPEVSLYLKEKVAADAKTESSSGKTPKSAQETEQGTESTLPEKPAKSAETLMIPPFSGDIFISDGVLNVVYPDRL